MFGIFFVIAVCLVYPGHEFMKFVVIGVVFVVGFVGDGLFAGFEIGKPLIVVVVVFGSRYSVHSGIARNTRFVDFGHPDVNPYGNDVIFILFKFVFVVGLIAAAGNGVFGVVNQQSCAVFRVSVGQNFRSQRAAFAHVIEISQRGRYEFGIQFMI